MPGVDVAGVLVGVGKILEVVGRSVVAVGVEALGALVQILDTEHRGDVVVLGEGVVEVQDAVVGLVEVPVVVVVGLAGTVPVVRAAEIVAHEVLLLGVLIVPAGAGLEVEPRGEDDREGLVHVELVRVVVVGAVRVGQGHGGVLDVAARARVVLAVGIVHAEGGRQGQGARKVVAVAVAVLDRGPRVVGEVERGAGVQPAADLVVAVEHEGDPVVVVVQGVTLGTVVTDGGIVGTLVVAALEVHAVVLREGRGLEVQVGHGLALPEHHLAAIDRVHHFAPARVGKEGGIGAGGVVEHTPEGAVAHAAVERGLAVAVIIKVAGTVRLDTGEGAHRGETAPGAVGELRHFGAALVGHTHVPEVLVGREELVRRIEVVGGELRAHVDGAVAFLAALGGHEDHAVRRTGTVDGGRTGVLEDFDGLDVVRVDVTEAGTLGTVDDDERGTGPVEVGTAAENHRRGGARVTGGLPDGEAGNGTGEGLGRVRMHTGGEDVLLDGGDGVRHLRAELAAAVGGNHRLFEEVLVVGHHDVERTAVPGNLSRGVTDAGDDEDVAHLRIRLDELTLDVRHHAGGDGSSLDQDGGHDDRLALCVLHRSLAGPVLGEEVASSQEHDAKQRKDCKQFL